MVTTPTDLVNRALAQIGTKSQITSLTDGSPEAIYANLLYGEIRDFMLRQGDYDFAIAATVPVLNPVSPGVPWLYSYAWPAGALRIRSLVPAVNFTYDDPWPIEFDSVYNVRILTKVTIASIVFTIDPGETDWDPIFTEAFVRMLGSTLAFALENRIEASREKLQEALSFAGVGEQKHG